MLRPQRFCSSKPPFITAGVVHLIMPAAHGMALAFMAKRNQLRLYSAGQRHDLGDTEVKYTAYTVFPPQAAFSTAVTRFIWGRVEVRL